MSREPDFFIGSLFVSDRFHECNHKVCSWRYKSSAYAACRSTPWNTSSAEQLNSKLDKRAASIRWMNLENAVSSSAMFMAGNNIDAWKKSEAWANRK